MNVTITDIDGTSTTSTFGKVEILIGRVKGNDIVLPMTNVTKRHARIVKKDGKIILIDMKSSNGTFLNGYKISEPRQLYEGDKFFIGNFTLEVHESGETGPAPLDPDMVKILNANFNIPTPTKPAATSPEPGEVADNTLIDASVDVNARNKDGQTPLHICKHVAMARALIEAGADVNARDHQGRTPLHQPICWNDNVVKMLVEAGAEVNAKDKEGKTLLHKNA